MARPESLLHQHLRRDEILVAARCCAGRSCGGVIGHCDHAEQRGALLEMGLPA